MTYEDVSWAILTFLCGLFIGSIGWLIVSNWWFDLRMRRLERELRRNHARWPDPLLLYPVWIAAAHLLHHRQASTHQPPPGDPGEG